MRQLLRRGVWNLGELPYTDLLEDILKGAETTLTSNDRLAAVTININIEAIKPKRTTPNTSHTAMAPHSTSPPPSTSNPSSAPPIIHPSLPLPSPSLSYWQRTTRAFPYLTHNLSPTINPPPTTTPILIIGSGLSGCLTAYTLIHTRHLPPTSITILEAREAVSGASGRNAGHVRPDAFRGFTGYAKLHGEEQAVKILQNEKLVFERLARFVKENDVGCDFHETTTLDVCLTEEFAKLEREGLERYREAGGEVGHVKCWEGSEEAERRTRVAGAVAAYEWPAGSIHPAKLAQWLLRRCVDAGVGLWTYCPVIGVERGADEGGGWRVKTPRGDVEAEKVVHCTNAYAAALLPQLEAFVTPNRAQAHSLVPGGGFVGRGGLEETMSLRYSLHHFYSLVQRQGDGTFILGVSRANPELSEETKKEIVSFDDGRYNEEIVEDALRQFKVMFPDAHSKQQRHGEGLDHAWTGVIAMTPDSVPMVGAVPELPGQYICAGFNGHGMARIFTSAPGVAALMTGGSWDDTGLPECFEYSTERLSRTKEKRQNVSVW